MSSFGASPVCLHTYLGRWGLPQGVRELSELLLQNQPYAPSWRVLQGYWKGFSERGEASEPVLIMASQAVQTRGAEWLGAALWRRVVDGAELDYLVVRKSSRSQGVGQALMLTAHSLLWGLGVSQAQLEVSNNNLAAIRLYRSQGYEEVSRRKRYYRNGEDALVFVRSLES